MDQDYEKFYHHIVYKLTNNYDINVINSNSYEMIKCSYDCSIYEEFNLGEMYKSELSINNTISTILKKMKKLRNYKKFKEYVKEKEVRILNNMYKL
jgi:hypothetical protein